MQKIIVTKVDRSRWTEAQKNELAFAEQNHHTGDDWNGWWEEKFDNYKTLAGKRFADALETGCGPHTNMRLILPYIKTDRLYFEDPLIRCYLDIKVPLTRMWKALQRGKKKPTPQSHLATLFANPQYRTDLSAAMLEDLPYKDGMMDLVVCINVLDHVEDVEKCMSEMNRVLKPSGYLVIGQDLSNEEDFKRCPESWEDICHPIKVDEATMNSYIPNYERIFYKVLLREEGRNPEAHYGTYLLIGKKLK
jgi:SAM-dependent methyltransferase